MTAASSPVVPDPHLFLLRPVGSPRARVCEECARLGTPWVHLRQCLTCGEILCCDSSPMRHARGHAGATGHVIVRSIEPGESWRWCYADEQFV
ncbi:MAG: UBP-type zinc finger domain-containing protein [Microbacterium sp.]